MPWTPVHILAPLVLCSLWFMMKGESPDWNLVALSIAGALLPDVDHLVVLVTGHSAFILRVRELIRSRRLLQTAKLFMARDRKQMGPMYLHNFAFLLVLSAFGMVALCTYNLPAVFFIVLGVFPHMCTDMIDDLFVFRSLRNWKRLPEA